MNKIIIPTKRQLKRFTLLHYTREPNKGLQPVVDKNKTRTTRDIGQLNEDLIDNVPITAPHYHQLVYMVIRIMRVSLSKHHVFSMYESDLIDLIAEPLDKVSNCGARYCNAFVCMHIYIYPSQSTIVALIDCAIGKVVQPIR